MPPDTLGAFVKHLPFLRVFGVMQNGGGNKGLIGKESLIGSALELIAGFG